MDTALLAYARRRHWHGIALGTGVAMTVTAPDSVVSAGSTLQVTSATTNAFGQTVTPTVTWSSSDPTIATVDSSGLVTGVSWGAVTITASSGAASATLSLEVDMLRSATATLTNAQVKALPTTPITLVAAPGAGSALIPVAVVTSTDTDAAAYTNIDPDGYLRVGTNAVDWCFPAFNESPDGVGLTALLGVASKKYVAVNTAPAQLDTPGWGITPSPTQRATVEDKALTLSISNGLLSNLTGGNAANSMKVTVFYVLVAV